MLDRLKQQLDFLLEIDRLKEVLRQSYICRGLRKENSSEHSWHLAVMALVLAEHAGAAIDTLRVVKMALVHDLVEIDAGDTFCYDEAGNADKAAREAVLPIASSACCRVIRAASFAACGKNSKRAQLPKRALQPPLTASCPSCTTTPAGAKPGRSTALRQLKLWSATGISRTAQRSCGLLPNRSLKTPLKKDG